MTQAVTGMLVTMVFMVCDTPMNMPVIWNSDMNAIAAQAHTTQPTLKRGPGMRFTASSPASAMAMV